MNKKGLLIGFCAYALWGFLPLFWHLLADVNPLVILCCRVIFSTVFTFVLLAAQGLLKEVSAALRDRRQTLRLLLASLLVTANWGLYIWAVNCGHVLDASLGYYINPLVSVALGVLLFRDRCTKLDLFALGLALLGVLISTVSYGAFPWIALALAGTFATYGVLKKRMHMDATVSMFIETLLMTPPAAAFLLLSDIGRAAAASLTLSQGLLLLACGPATAVPLILYARGVNVLPLSTMGFLQYVCPTLIMLTGVLFLQERFTPDKAVAFAFILMALVIYTLGLVVRERRGRNSAPLPEKGDA